jgi:hypothetical protein
MITPDRGLIIRPEYLNLILLGEKTWEMRSTITKIRGVISLIESGSGLVVGSAMLTQCLPPLRNATQCRNTYRKHRVADMSLLKKWRYPWELRLIEKYNEPLRYSHPRGAVIWVKNLNNRLLGE